MVIFRPSRWAPLNSMSCSSGIGCECVLFGFIAVDVKDRNLFLLSRDERALQS